MNRNMYPNPTTGKINISLTLKGTYQIYNEVGRVFTEGDISEFLDLTDYPKGMYMLLLNVENEHQYVKIIKQ